MIIRVKPEDDNKEIGYFTLQNDSLSIHGFERIPKGSEVLLRIFAGQVFILLDDPKYNDETRKTKFPFDESMSKQKRLIEVMQKLNAISCPFVYMWGMYVQIPQMYITDT